MTGPDFTALPSSMLDEPPAELLDWAHGALARAGYRVSSDGPVLRRRSWSTVIRLDTDRGPVWIKGNARAFGVEAALTALLDRHAAGHVAAPITFDPVRCRLITADGGRTLRESGGATEAGWTSLLTGYAGLQSAMTRHRRELQAIGLPDMTPPQLPGWYRAVLDRVHAEPALSALVTDAELAALEDLMPATVTLAAELATDGLPMTVEHNDLHRGNVFAGDRCHGPRIFDWGDATIAHPFHCLGRTVTVAAGDVPGDGATAGRLRENVLRVWSGGADIPVAWRRSAAVAGLLSQLTTAASWLRIDLTATPERAGMFVGLLVDYARQVPVVLDA